MTVNEKDCRSGQVLAVAKAMMAAARTAPKGKGTDRLEIVTVHGREELHALAERMRAISDEMGFKFFLRDADNVEKAEAVVLIGTTIGTFGLNCGFCGFADCEAKLKFADVPCAFNINDMGIAIGSAVSVAADMRVDNRVMWSAARGAMELGLIEGCSAAFAILLSCTGKSPFFDRVVNK